MTTLQEFIFSRKQSLLQKEKLCRGRTRDAIVSQVQALESVLIYLQSKQEAEDMAKLEIMLDDQAVSIEEIQGLRRRGTGELTELLKGFAKKIKPGSGKSLKLPEGIKPSVVTAKIHFLRKTGILPESILPSTIKGTVWMKNLNEDQLEEWKEEQKRRKPRG